MFSLLSSCGNNTDFTNPKEVAEDGFKLITTGEVNEVYDQYISDTSKSLFTKEEFKEVYGYSDTTLDKKSFKLLNISKISIDPSLEKFRRYQLKYLIIDTKKKDTTKKYLYKSLVEEGSKWKLLYNFPLKKTGLKEYQAQNYDQAIEAFNEALKYDPVDGWCYKRLGWCYNRQSNQYYAKKKAKKSIKLSPKEHSVYNLLAAIYSNEGKEEIALKKYQEALNHCTEEEDKTYLYGNMINSHLELEDLNKAKALTNKLLKIDSTNTTAWWRKGEIYNKQNKLDTALKFYHEAIKERIIQAQLVQD